MYQYGYGTGQSYQKAFELYTQSAAKNCGLGEFRLGWLYAHSDYVKTVGNFQIPKDIEKAKALYRSAAQHGYKDSAGAIDYLLATGNLLPF